MHPRRVIRNAVTDAIIAAGTAMEDRVFPARVAPAEVSSLLAEGPICNVYSRRDYIKPEDYPVSGFDGAVRRCLELAIEITAVGSWTVDDKLDDLAEEVELIFEDWTPASMPATEVRLESTQVDVSDEFEQPLGGALLMFEVRYWKEYRRDTSEDRMPCYAFAQPPGEDPAYVAKCPHCAEII